MALGISDLLGAAGIGGVLGKAIVSLELETTKYQAELKAAQAQTTAGTNSMATGVSNFSKLAQTAFLGVGVAAVAGIAVSIKAASDLNEQINKTKEVFEDNADTVLAWGETTAESMGISETAAIGAASSFGQILDAAGLAEDATSEMSMALVGLASDLASFNNVDPNIALEKLQSGLAGMARPLREFGVFISASRVESVAYANGIAKVGEELTDAQKIQARYKIILEDTTKAQGDFSRTLGESIPNQMRVMKAELEDTAAKLGTAFLPIVLEAAKAILEMVKALEPLLDLVGKAGPVFRIWGEAISFVLFPLEKLIGLLNTLAEITDRGIKPTDEMTTLIGEQAQAFQDGQAWVEKYHDELYGVETATEKTGKAIVKFAHMTDDALDKWASETEANLHDAIFALQDFSTESGVTQNDVVHAFRFMKQEARQLSQAFLEMSREKWINDEFVEFISQQAPEWITAFASLSKEKQMKVQEDFLATTRFSKDTNQSFETMIGTLDKLDKGSSKHDVFIEYHYVGFDPSKPGMAGTSTGHGGQQ